MIEALRPCPFCNGEAVLRTKYSRHKELYFTSVVCTECGTRTRAISSLYKPEADDTNSVKQLAVTFWNRRPGDPTGEEAAGNEQTENRNLQP